MAFVKSFVCLLVLSVFQTHYGLASPTNGAFRDLHIRDVPGSALTSSEVPTQCAGADLCGYDGPACLNDTSASPEDMGKCICTQDLANHLTNCFNCAVSNSNGAFTASDGQSVFDSYISSCQALGISINNVTIGGSSTGTGSSSTNSSSTGTGSSSTNSNTSGSKGGSGSSSGSASSQSTGNGAVQPIAVSYLGVLGFILCLSAYLL
ncbi:hypothetical protein D9758_015868 [Tetrapyrgos nigripes]|uniref:Uncharacterized protein n=1 Tax=Tetrapyrgos nigripes TaxID=182062 RepID=A0A8H5FMZ9_9AGAR|nr:hypothetical protein D9758_015868 [Tetrapyrgos nigripes]